jgi:hypothetical protein
MKNNKYKISIKKLEKVYKEIESSICNDTDFNLEMRQRTFDVVISILNRARNAQIEACGEIGVLANSVKQEYAGLSNA